MNKPSQNYMSTHCLLHASHVIGLSMELADVVRTAVVEDLKKNSREFLNVSIMVFISQIIHLLMVRI